MQFLLSKMPSKAKLLNRAIYTGENKTRADRINGTKKAFVSYFRRD